METNNNTYNKAIEDYHQALAQRCIVALGKDALVFTEETFVKKCIKALEQPLMQLQALVQAGFVRQNRTEIDGKVHFTYNLTTSRRSRLKNLKKSVDELNFNIAEYKKRHSGTTNAEHKAGFAQIIENMKLGLVFIQSAQKYLESSK